ncbi:hypothetical protein MKX01_008396 [Papaver californicum]|nr:hypothetical protein MKX01_008396 [Papaver californicum]
MTSLHENDDITSDEHHFVLNNQHDLIIDLGLSFGTSLQVPDDQAYLVNPAELGELMGWSHQLNPYMKASISNVYHSMVMLDDEETEVVQSKERWAYVKVNMEGIVIGRKVCIHEHAGFTSLAIQLEDMFDTACPDYAYFDTESEFSLFYKDSTECWRTVGDRLRITRKDGVFFWPMQVSNLGQYVCQLTCNLPSLARRSNQLS